MLIQITNLLLQVFVSIVAGACLLRCYIQWLGSNLGAGQIKSIGSYLHPLTNWIILPIRRVIPSLGRFDTASFLAAYVLVLGKTIILSWISGLIPLTVSSLIITSIELLDLTISGLIWLVFASVILSWISAGSQIQCLISLLVEPLLRPIRRVIPNLGTLDLSPLVLLLILQVLQIVLSSLK
ncbi:YggT family protein [Polynucleobacter sp. IMCC 29146]|uniref:YggT family protein n=1 Tax=Polynucleobacter sp. IMCC 29146 TaxID=2780953 RepID=UPI001F1CB45F|nr:YggT family protein [Polynucleobacter sp. IMCC 29146]MCE7530531.1 YggT family protein [Polynucleobacter sp. IMCC 29146]